MAVVDFRSDTRLETSLTRLFPLPLTALESFMLNDVREGYPIMCDLLAHFEGCLDRAAFDAGVAFALARNPLFGAIVDFRRDNRRRKQAPVWIKTDRSPRVDWAPADTSYGASYDSPLDLAVEPGLRIFARPGHDHSTVLFQFHHACTDGVGSFGFLEDFLAGYAQAFDGPVNRVTPRQLDPTRLLQRGTAGMSPRSLYRRVTDPYVGAREGMRFFAQAPLPLAPGPDAVAEPASVPASRPCITEICSAELTLAVRSTASAAQVNLNDLLLRDLFIALCTWNARHGRQPDGRRLRILMPQNLRSRDDAAMSAANAMSFAFLTRSTRQCKSPSELLASIRAETERIRNDKLSLYFLGSIASLQSAGLLEWLLNRKICFASAILSNVGEPTRRFGGRFPRTSSGLVVGNLLLNCISGAPPLRPLTRAAFCVGNSARHLMVHLKTDPRHFSVRDTQSLLRTYLDQLTETAAGSIDREAF